MSIEYKSCGCSFETNDKGLPIFNPNIISLPLDCSRTWDLICDGNTKGVFQLESYLGQSKSRDSQPRNIAELADVISIIRPGCNDAVVDGKTLTQHYIDRKAKRDEVKYFHPTLEPILKNTYGILVYQEQALAIAKELAGYSLSEAEILRKAIGKKDIELMTKVKSEFADKAVEHGILTRADAVEIFSWIEKSQKYSFNASHAVAYALNAYQTAYAKAHFPRAFFAAYIRHSGGKPKPFIEVNELVNNARIMDIDIRPPNILNMIENCELIGGEPHFGLTNVKKVGKSVFKDIKKIIDEKGYDIASMTWDQFLMKIGRYVKKDSFENMIAAGAFDCYKISRNEMLYGLQLFIDLRDKDHNDLEQTEQETFVGGLEEAAGKLLNQEKIGFHDRNRIELLQSTISSLLSPPFSLLDMPSWIAKKERELLGIELTCTEIDEYDTLDANCTCREYIKGFSSNVIAIAAKISSVREYAIKKGKNKGSLMAFIRIEDGTCALEGLVCFSDDWEKNKKDAKEGAIVLIRGTRDKKNKESFLVKKVQKLKQCI